MKSDLQRYLKTRKDQVDQFLDHLLSPTESCPKTLHQAMRYSLFPGGKRLRPILVIAAFEACGGRRSKWLLPVAGALELIHTYSLIHDDLPAMDNDDLRRGRPTHHKVFGEAMAILAGDALLTLAFQLMTPARPGRQPTIRPINVRLLQIIHEISRASGCAGMVGGQAADILSTGQPADASTLEYIHRHKTAALIRASVRSGAILAGASPRQLRAMTCYGESIGLAFQIMDDILDVEGNREEMGKDTHGDQSKGKLTYPRLYGLDRSKDKARSLIDQAIRDLAPLGAKAMPLIQLAEYCTERKK